MPRYKHASSIESTQCTIGLPGGNFCDRDRAPGAPLPICTKHARQLYGWMHGMVTDARQNPHKHLAVHNTVVSEVAERRYAEVNTPAHCVYYVRIGNLIKVGTTTNLQQRLAAYPPGSELLAAELGGEAREAQRLRQFNHLLASRKEWFHPGADLMIHIGKLKAMAA